MNIDERLDRLAGPHEALTQSVELLVHSRIKTEEALQKNQVILANLMENVGSVARIARGLEAR